MKNLIPIGRRYVALDAIVIAVAVGLIVFLGSYAYENKRAGDLPFTEALKIYSMVIEHARPGLQQGFVVSDRAVLRSMWFGSYGDNLLRRAPGEYKKAIAALSVDSTVTWNVWGLSGLGYNVVDGDSILVTREVGPEDVVVLSPIVYDRRAEVAVVTRTIFHTKVYPRRNRRRFVGNVFLLQKVDDDAWSIDKVFAAGRD